MQAQFTFVTTGGTITIMGYTGPGGAVTIPSTINGLPVTRIGDQAFSYCNSLTSITIPASVTSIGDAAFYACDSLMAITVDALNSVYSSVDGVVFNQSQTMLVQWPGGKAGSYTIPNNVTSIGDYAFAGTRLTNVTILNNVTRIGISAFFGSDLTSVTIGISVTSIGDHAFAGCDSLTAITVDALNSFYSSVAGVLFNQSLTVLLQYPRGKAGSDYTIGNSVTNIGASAFANCFSLTTVTIGNSVTRIGGRVLWQRPDQRYDPEQRHQHRGPSVLLLHQPDQRHNPQQRHQYRGRRVPILQQPDQRDDGQWRHQRRGRGVR